MHTSIALVQTPREEYKYHTYSALLKEHLMLFYGSLEKWSCDGDGLTQSQLTTAALLA